MRKKKKNKKDRKEQDENTKQKLFQEKKRMEAQNKVLMKIIGGVTYYKPSPNFEDQ